MKPADYPEIGVMPWKQWAWDVATMVTRDFGSLRWRQMVRQVTQGPLRSNPWRRCFARYVMTPGEAIYTIGKR